MIEIPPERLPPDALEGVIESYILREGTDYGASETPFSTKVDQVRRQLARGEVVILFDNDSETCNLVTREEFRRIQAQSDG